MKPSPLSLLLVSTIFLHSAAVVCAQSSPAADPPEPERASARITLATGEIAQASGNRGVFDRVGLRPNELVTIEVQYPAAKAGQTIRAGALDGGRVIAPPGPLKVAADGTVRFRFQAGKEPGVYQIALNDGSGEMGLQFWVLDERNPQNNRPVINREN
jgi:hypothetical protein